MKKIGYIFTFSFLGWIVTSTPVFAISNISKFEMQQKIRERVKDRITTEESVTNTDSSTETKNSEEKDSDKESTEGKENSNIPVITEEIVNVINSREMINRQKERIERQQQFQEMINAREERGQRSEEEMINTESIDTQIMTDRLTEKAADQIGVSTEEFNEKIRSRRVRFNRPNTNTIKSKKTSEAAQEIRSFILESGKNFEKFERIPPALQENFQELAKQNAEDIQSIIEKIRSTEDPVEKAAFKEELRTYLKEQKEARKKLIEEEIQLPNIPEMLKPEKVKAQLDNISAALAEAGVETILFTERAKSFVDALTVAEQAANELKKNRSFETIRELRDALKTVQNEKEELRNLMTSLIAEIPIISN